MNKKKILLILFLIPAVFTVFIIYNNFTAKEEFLSGYIKPVPSPTDKPLAKYSINNLKKRKNISSEIKINDKLIENEKFTSYSFEYKTNGKKATGTANIPQKPDRYPIIILLRGWVDPSEYTPTTGSKRIGEYLAQNGYITLAPDFLGYSASDNPSQNPMEERFETYTTSLDLIASLSSLNIELKNKNLKAIYDEGMMGIWGHSNGGHIGMTVLETSNIKIPSVFWAPVSIHFPYSILYYTDEYDDRGKSLRLLVSNFENDYDSDDYSLTMHLNNINSPIQIHQGLSDESVPPKWNNLLFESLNNLEKDVKLFSYPGENHNFNNGSFPLASLRTLEFFDKNLKEK